MKYLIVDDSSKVILTFDQDIRISSNLKRAVFDVDVFAIYPHHEYYENIFDKSLFENNIIFEDGKGIDILLEEDCPSYIKNKKQICLRKRKLLNLLFKILERTTSSYSYFINQSMVSVFENETMKELYYEFREFNKEHALKDLEIRRNTNIITMVKLQACVDDFIDMIILSNNFEELSKIENKIRERML